MIKKTLLFLGFAILSGLALLAYINKGAIIEVSYIKGIVECDIFALVLVVMTLSAVAAGFIFQGNVLELEQQLKRHSRNNEKANIVKEESQDKVRLLEAKVQTLEKALEDALKRD